MIKVIAFRERTWIDFRTDFRQWDQTCRAYGVSLQLIERDWNEAEIPTGHSVVILDQAGAVDLVEFVHPENAVYIFGRTGMNDLLTAIEHDCSVRIETPQPKSMFGISVCGAVLHDRRSKACRDLAADGLTSAVECEVVK